MEQQQQKNRKMVDLNSNISAIKCNGIQWKWKQMFQLKGKDCHTLDENNTNSTPLRRCTSNERLEEGGVNGWERENTYCKQYPGRHRGMDSGVSGNTMGRRKGPSASERLSVPGRLNRAGACTSKAKIGKTAREKRIYSYSRDLNASQELIGYVDQKNQLHLWVLI